MPPFGLGAIRRPQDDRDLILGSAAVPLHPPYKGTDKPERPAVPVRDQGKYPTCGAHAGAMLMSLLASDQDDTIDNLSPKYLWRRIKQIDGFPLEDGTDMRSIFKALQKYGTCAEQYLPSDLGSSLEDYSKADFTAEEDGSANWYRIDNYAFKDAPSFDEIKAAIETCGYCIALVDIGDHWWANGYAEAAVCPLALGNFVGHHFVCLYDYDEQYIYGVNSFGSDWGKQGDFYMDASYVPHVIEIGTAVPSTLRIRAILLYRKALSLLASILSSKGGA